MSAAHTPGPWHLEVVEDDSGRIKKLVPADSDKQSLLTTVEWDGVKFAAVFVDADARLIAAAPDLLEALQAIVEWDKEREPLTQELIDQANAAIAKATGGAA